MAIDRDKHSGFHATCDSCDDVEETPDAESFQEVIQEIKSQGWAVRMTDDGWAHICPACVKEMP